MGIIHLVYDNGDDYPCDGDDRYKHALIVDERLPADTIQEVRVSFDEVYAAKEYVLAKLEELRNLPPHEKIYAIINYLENELKEDEWADRQRAQAEALAAQDTQTSLKYGAWGVKIEPGTTLKAAIKKAAPGGRVPRGYKCTWYLNNKPVAMDYVLQQGDKIIGYKRMMEH